MDVFELLKKISTGEKTDLLPVEPVKNEEDYKEAVDKINSEINKKNHPFIKVIGEYLLKYIDENPSAILKILKENKTIEGSLKEIEKEARKSMVKEKKSGYAYVSDEDGYLIVLKYFGVISSENEEKENTNDDDRGEDDSIEEDIEEEN